MQIGKVGNGTRSLYVVDDMSSPDDDDTDPRIAIELPSGRIGLNADQFVQLMQLCEVALATLRQRRQDA